MWKCQNIQLVSKQLAELIFSSFQLWFWMFLLFYKFKVCWWLIQQPYFRMFNGHVLIQCIDQNRITIEVMWVYHNFSPNGRKFWISGRWIVQCTLYDCYKCVYSMLYVPIICHDAYGTILKHIHCYRNSCKCLPVAFCLPFNKIKLWADKTVGWYKHVPLIRQDYSCML